MPISRPLTPEERELISARFEQIAEAIRKGDMEFMLDMEMHTRENPNPKQTTWLEFIPTGWQSLKLTYDATKLEKGSELVT